MCVSDISQARRVVEDVRFLVFGCCLRDAVEECVCLAVPLTISPREEKVCLRRGEPRRVPGPLFLQPFLVAVERFSSSVRLGPLPTNLSVFVLPPSASMQRSYIRAKAPTRGQVGNASLRNSLLSGTWGGQGVPLAALRRLFFVSFREMVHLGVR